MSRQFVQQQQVEVERRTKRTDWSEYIDPDINIDDDQGDLCEPNVVTELPKPLFKKPKLRDNYSAAGLDCEDGAKLRRPVFGKRNVKKKVDYPDLFSSKSEYVAPTSSACQEDCLRRIGASASIKKNKKIEVIMLNGSKKWFMDPWTHGSKLDKEPRTIGKENFNRHGENQLNHNYADKEIGVSSKWGQYNKFQQKDNIDHSFAYKATSSIMSKFKRPVCDNVDHGFTSLGSSSVMTKLKRPASKWNDFLDDDNDLELEMSRFEETNNAAFERKVLHKEPRTIGKENFKRHGENQLNHNYADKEIGVSSKWGQYNKFQQKDNIDHSFAYKATSSIMSKFKRSACDSVDHGFTSLGSSSVMTKLKRPASKWNDFLDEDNDLELEMSRLEETNNAAFERKVSDEIVEDDVHPDFL
ncbi:hypothetical protein CTI12_AA571960 [Artemisia annua]|uniref:Uncharacterized protein n=1 Tax=Artemisia annua TaxID=35608 RepID=A0A2U1KRQ3_ARTAN|nr:hypothetical protein CTI12_AA571960 [Artemisia annua]